MEVVMRAALVIVFAYLLGSIPFGKIIGLGRGIDIQKHGSGNIGFANAVRVLGWRPALLVLLGDVAKGYIPVFIASATIVSPMLLMISAGLAAILGHIFPIWLKGRGGKGIATSLGVTFAINPLVALYGLSVYLIVFSMLKKSAPSSLIATWFVPLVCYITLSTYLAYLYAGIALLITWAHRSNIRQMIAERRGYAG